MDWMKQLNAVIDYIEENLDNDISYDQIAVIAGCSKYNFQRLFSYIAQMSLAEYIRNRRLTLAAFEVTKADDKMIDIAIKYGYESQDAFSRAFRKYHGILPSKARKEPVTLKSCPKLSFQISVSDTTNMKYQIVKWPAFNVTGISHRIQTDKAFEAVPNIWEKAWEDGTMMRLIEQFTTHRPSGFLGIAAGGGWGSSDEMDYILAVTNHVAIPDSSPVSVPEGMEQFSYPAATWVIINADGQTPKAIFFFFDPLT